MKYLIILTLIYSLSFADTILNGSCVSSFYTLGNKIYYTTVSGTFQTNYTDTIINTLSSNIDKFTYDSTSLSCVAVMSSSNKVFLSSLTGILIGFTILFFSVQLAILIGSKR